MNWYRKYKTSSILGQTIGKWLMQARDGYVDMYNLASDVRQSLQEEGTTIADASVLDGALSEAHMYLVNNGQTQEYNNYQRSVVDFVRNMIYSDGEEQLLMENNNVI